MVQMEAKFKTELDTRWRKDDKTAVVLSDLVYASAVLGKMSFGYLHRITVPKGFTTDFASVPRFLPLVFSLVGDSAHKAAVLHDYLYQTHKVGPIKITRSMADSIFLEAMKVTKVPLLKRQMMFWGVRLGGSGSWKSGPTRFKIYGNIDPSPTDPPVS